MAKLSQKYIDLAKEKNPGEPEFIQTVEEVLSSIEPVLEAHPEYVKAGLIERLIDRIEVSHDKQITVCYRFQSEFENYVEVLKQCRNM